MAAAAPEILATTPAEFSRLTRTQKIAMLLVVLGEETAVSFLRSLHPDELESISAEMAKVGMLSIEMQNTVLKEFTDVAIQASTSLRGGFDFTQAMLEKSLGLYKAATVISRVLPTRTPVSSMTQIVELEPRQIFNLLKLEQPQTISLILSYLPTEKASQLLIMLRPDLRDQVIERLATLAPTPIEIVEKVVEQLNRKLGTQHTRALNLTGGLKSAANLLNSLDKNLTKSLLQNIEERNPELGQAIRQKMFTFEDVATLDTPVLQKVLREVDLRDLAVALKTASDTLKGALLSAVSKRAAETVQEEMSFMGPLKLRDIEAAQMRIIELVRKAEADNEGLSSS
ncbi:MAG: flagellar motor switch protein FliG [Verrucomicrobium sp.]|jgi:flagellar motor switch protein FliG|nr:flagellar motor switch protein FliG [Verrucomicrobium sp.]